MVTPTDGEPVLPGAAELAAGAPDVVVVAAVGCDVPDDLGVEPVPQAAASAARPTPTSRRRRAPGPGELTGRFSPGGGRRRWRP